MPTAEAHIAGLLADLASAEWDHARRYPPAKRGITEGMYDRVRANPSASRIFVTRLEWELLKAANGIAFYEGDESKATVLGLPVVVLEDVGNIVVSV